MVGNALGAKFLEADRSFMGGTSIFWGFGDQVESKMLHCMKNKLPFFHLDHAYFKRGYENGNFRFNYNHFHQVGIFKLDDFGTPLAAKRLQDWKVGKHVVIVVPSERIVSILREVCYHWKNAEDWVRFAELEVKRHTNRPVVVKHKGGSILDALKDAHACVSLSSVAEVESVVYGVPVFTSEHSPAFHVSSGEISNIESPKYPDRSDWLKTLSYSQFHLDEFADGRAITKLERLYGNLNIRRATDCG